MAVGIGSSPAGFVTCAVSGSPAASVATSASSSPDVKGSLEAVAESLGFEAGDCSALASCPSSEEGVIRPLLPALATMAGSILLLSRVTTGGSS